MKNMYVLLFLSIVAFSSCNSNQSQKQPERPFVALTSDISYREGGSKSWVLDLAVPMNFGDEGLRPAIVLVHGGGWRAGSKQDIVFRNLLIDYALQGYVTLSVGYRFDQEAAFPACIEDVKCAVRWLKAHAKELRVDPERIGTYGHSAGAHLAMMLGVSSDNADLEGDGPWKEYSSKVACAVGGAPPTEIGNPNNPWSQHPEWWPIGYISAKVSPLLLCQGIEDPIVKVELTDDYVEKMRATDADIEYVRIKGGHDVAYNVGLAVTKPAMDAFFAKHLKK
ncbi:alpha/beta hydrolase [Parabacteroides sp. OttesenSCG-928-J18]|nr:alpha/beta hydrolase [Parabacteroides sp. OttesenSCG-928-J18]